MQQQPLMNSIPTFIVDFMGSQDCNLQNMLQQECHLFGVLNAKS